MTTSPGLSPLEAAHDLSLGVAPMFGNVPVAPFEHTPEHLVLSSEAYSRLSGIASLSRLTGTFADERLGRGFLTVKETASPGQVHVHADVQSASGPMVHLDAEVRESWLNRAALQSDGTAAPGRVFTALLRLAEIPTQSTVSIRVEAEQ